MVESAAIGVNEFVGRSEVVEGIKVKVLVVTLSEKKKY